MSWRFIESDPVPTRCAPFSGARKENVMNTKNPVISTATHYTPAQELRVKNHLEPLLAFWLTEGNYPVRALMLEDDEHDALTIAAKNELRFYLGALAIERFLRLPPWLQRWTLEQRGWGEYIGRPLGHEVLGAGE